MNQNTFVQIPLVCEDFWSLGRTTTHHRDEQMPYPGQEKLLNDGGGGIWRVGWRSRGAIIYCTGPWLIEHLEQVNASKNVLLMKD